MAQGSEMRWGPAACRALNALTHVVANLPTTWISTQCFRCLMRTTAEWQGMQCTDHMAAVARQERPFMSARTRQHQPPYISKHGSSTAVKGSTQKLCAPGRFSLRLGCGLGSQRRCLGPLGGLRGLRRVAQLYRRQHDVVLGHCALARCAPLLFQRRGREVCLLVLVIVNPWLELQLQQQAVGIHLCD